MSSTVELNQWINTVKNRELAFDFMHFSKKVKKKKTVLFFGRNNFSDNSKYLYLYALKNPGEYELIWCTTDDHLFEKLSAKNLPCLNIKKNFDRTVDIFLHAAVAIFSVSPIDSVGSVALLGCLSGAKKLQLWHGISVKNLILQLIPHIGLNNNNLRNVWIANTSADYVLSTSSFFDGYWREVFGCQNLIRAGLPRNDVINRDATLHEMLGAEISEVVQEAIHSGRPNVLIVPTWQRSKPTSILELSFLRELLTLSKNNNINFFLKMHPALNVESIRMSLFPNSDKMQKGLYFIDNRLDIYPWLRNFNALVTDYSSIMFDFLLTGSPVLTLKINPNDHEKFEPDYSFVPEGNFRILFEPSTFKSTLMRALETDCGLPDRQDYISKIFESDPRDSCEKLMLLIKSLLDQSQQVDHKVLYL